MSDTVKVIIEIDKRAYKGCQKLRTNDDDGIVGLCAVNAIANGIPLDDVKAEIEKKCDRINSIASVLSYPRHREIQELLCEILASIGKGDVCAEEKSDVPERDSEDISHIFDNVTQEEFEKIAKTIIEGGKE